jgi:hypothetical protein
MPAVGLSGGKLGSTPTVALRQNFTLASRRHARFVPADEARVKVLQILMKLRRAAATPSAFGDVSVSPASCLWPELADIFRFLGARSGTGGFGVSTSSKAHCPVDDFVFSSHSSAFE